MELKHESITLSSLVRRALNPTCSILICFSREGGGVLAPGLLLSLNRRVQGILRYLLSLAWPFCLLKSSLQSLKNSWGRLVASVREWVNCDWHFGHRFSESKSLSLSWHYQVVQTRVTVSNFLFQITLSWTMISTCLKWLLIRGSNHLLC